MSKWKCGICGSGFDNFQAQGFEGTIYCPLCYYKKLYKDTELERERLNRELKKYKYSADELNEIERLNNIINELEKESYLGMIENQNNNDYSKGLYIAYKYINDKLQELKEVDKK